MKINIPTKITIARIVLVTVLIVFLIVCNFLPADAAILQPIGDSGILTVNLIAAIVFVIASATDYLDGHLARKWNQVTDLGKFLDPIADKMLVNAILVYLCIGPFGNVAIPWFCVVLMILRDLIVDSMRLMAAKKGKVVAANIFGKMKTVFQMVAIPVILLNGWPFTYFDAGWGYGRICLIMIYIATAMSVISGIIYLKQNFHIIKEEKNDGADV